MFAFVKINGKSFNAFVHSLVSFIFSSQRYIWKKEVPVAAPQEKRQEKNQKNDATKTMSGKELKNLASSLDVKENNINSG